MAVRGARLSVLDKFATAEHCDVTPLTYPAWAGRMSDRLDRSPSTVPSRCSGYYFTGGKLVKGSRRWTAGSVFGVVRRSVSLVQTCVAHGVGASSCNRNLGYATGVRISSVHVTEHEFTAGYYDATP
jgi:hypothetical protein